MVKKSLLAVMLTTGVINATDFEFNTIKRDATGNIKANGQVIPNEKVIISKGDKTTKEQALKILKKSFEDLFSASSLQDMLNIKILSTKVEEGKVKGDRVPIRIEYEISVNYEKYIQKIKKLEQLFENIGGTLHKRAHIYKWENDKPLFDSYPKYTRPIDFNLYHEITVQKLSEKYTVFGIIKKYGQGHKLDIWSFPKSWKSLYYGKSVNIDKLIRVVLEIKNKDNEVLLAEELEEIAKTSFIGSMRSDFASYTQYEFLDNKIISPTFNTDETEVKKEIIVYMNLKEVPKIKKFVLELEEK